MKENNLRNKVLNATKWSAITEIAAKLVSPIINMILARLLVPEAFGVVATVTMIFSFADIFTDAGFEKYLVQHEFKNDEEKYQSTNVAFWSNFGISLLIWGVIALFCESIAKLVGNPGLGKVIAIGCIQLLFTSFSSIQIALYRRDFDFKTLFWVRLISICIPFVITIPLALLGFSYWALIIGTICGGLSNAVVLTVKSKWKPQFFYKVAILKEMLSFSIWSLIEAISIWLTSWVDALIIGSVLNAYYLGIYRTSISMVNTLMALVTASTAPILFSTLSRLQYNNEQFNNTFFNMQKFVSIFVFPFGVGIYLYSDLATQIFLGNQWGEASCVIGTWALTSSIVIVFGNLCSEVYRAKGRPKLSFLAQVLHLIILIPVCIISSKLGFWMLVYTRSWIRMEAVLVDFIIMKFVIGISISGMIKNTFPTAVAAFAMGCIGYFLQRIYEGMIWSFASIAMCVIFYFVVLCAFPSMGKELKDIIRNLKRK